MGRYLGIPRLPIFALCCDHRHHLRRQCQGLTGGGRKVNLVRGLILMRLMQSDAVVEVEIPSQSGLQFAPVLVGAQVNVLIFHAAPQPLDKNVVDPSALAIHADAGVLRFEHIGPCRVR